MQAELYDRANVSHRASTRQSLIGDLRSTQLGSILVGHWLTGNITEVVLPWVKSHLRRLYHQSDVREDTRARGGNSAERHLDAEGESFLTPYVSTFEDFSEMTIQVRAMNHPYVEGRQRKEYIIYLLSFR